MRKFLALALILGALIGISQQFKDVPVNHWAYEAVTEMAKLGVITGMPDGTFQGNSYLTRYQAAVAFYRLYNILKQPSVEVSGLINKVSTLEDLVSTALMKVQNLSDNFGGITSDLESLKNDVANLKSTLVDLKNLRMEVMSQLQSQSDTIQKLDSRVNDALSRIAALESKVSGDFVSKDYVDTRISQTVSRLSDLEKKLSTLETKTANLEALVKNTETSLKDYVEKTLKAYAETFDQKLSEISANLERNNTALSGEIGNLKVLVSKLQSDLETQQKTARALDARVSVLEGQVTTVNSRVENLEKRVSQVESSVGKISTLERNLGAVTARITKIEEEIQSLSQSNTELSQKVDEIVSSKPWMEDVNSVSATLSKKISDVQTMALAGVAIGIVGVIIGFVMGGSK